jgi:predicted GNAT family acetyltransferase
VHADSISIDHDAQRQRYEIRVDGELVGFLTYQRRGSEVALMHTEIEESLERHGLGTRLVAAALDDLRASGASVLPYCPFASSFIRTHPEYLDVVPADQRAAFRLTGPQS